MNYILYILNLLFLFHVVQSFVVPIEVSPKIANLVRKNQQHFCTKQISPFAYVICHEAPKYIFYNASLDGEMIAEEIRLNRINIQ